MAGRNGNSAKGYCNGLQRSSDKSARDVLAPLIVRLFCNGVETVNYDVHYITIKVYLRTVRNLDGFTVLTAPQLRAARALLGIDQQTLADMAGVSLPTVQRMEASTDYVRGVVATLTKVLEALDKAGIEVIGDGAASSAGGRGVRFKEPSR